MTKTFLNLLKYLSFGKSINRALLVIFFLGFIYLILPGASSIKEFPAIPYSTKSKLEGDTIQNPNISAYFSNFRRNNITNYYRDFFSQTLIPGVKLPIVISINRPPEEAYLFVRDQQESTFLEEYVFPFRESIYVNGYEPKVENDMFNKRDRSFVGDHLFYDEKYFNSKATIRYYPSNMFVRVIIYAITWIFGILLFKYWNLEIRKK